MRDSGGKGTSRPESAMRMGNKVSTALTCCLGRGYERTAADSLQVLVLRFLCLTIPYIPFLERPKPFINVSSAVVEILRHPVEERCWQRSLMGSSYFLKPRVPLQLDCGPQNVTEVIVLEYWLL